MKKLFLNFIFILCITSIFAQNAIRYNPNLTGGFVVVNDIEFPKATNWLVKVDNIIYRDSVNYDKNTVFKAQLLKTNYIRIPDNLFTSTDTCYELTVVGYDDNSNIITENTEIISEMPIGGSNFVDYYQYKCNGPTYSYKIVSHNRVVNNAITNSAYLDLDILYDQTEPDVVPNYVYMHSDEFNHLCSTDRVKFNAYYNCNCNYVDGIKIIYYPTISSTAQCYDSQGHIVAGSDIFAVAKGKGPWKPLYFQTVEIPTYSYWDIQQAVHVMNDFVINGFEENGYPALECIEVEAGSSATDNAAFLKCLKKVFKTGTDVDFNPDDDAQDFFDLLQELEDCYSGDYNGHGYDWPEFINTFAVISLDIPGTTVIIHQDSLVSVNGEIIAPNVVIEPGLYSLGFYLADDTYTYSVMNVKTKFLNSLEMSDFIDVTVFPVPIKENYFNLNIYSTYKQECLYELFDDKGTLIHSEKFELPQDKQIDYLVKPSTELPVGILINKFTFSDGSSKSISTIKQ